MTPILALSFEGMLSTAMVVFGIGFLIFFHELGHFLAAKAAGVRVHAFAIGMGPRVVGWRRGGTDYKLCLLPIGGFVRMHGEIPGEGDVRDPGSITSKSVGWRFLIFSGGVLMNVLFALIAFPIIFLSGVNFTAPVLGEISEGSAAWAAGLEKGDRVRAVDGSSVYSFEQLALESALAGDDGIELRVERGDREFDVRVHPKNDPSRGAKTLGARPPADPDSVVVLSPGESPARTAGLKNGDKILRWNGESLSPRAESKWRREMQVDPTRIKEPLDLVVERDGKQLEFTVTPKVRQGAKRLGVMLLGTRVVGLRSQEDAKLAEALRATGLRVGDVLLGLRVGESKLSFLLDEQMLREKLAGAQSASFEVLRVPAAAKSRLDSTRVQVQLPPYFLGADGAQRFTDAVGFGADTVSAHVYAQPGLAAARAGMKPGDRLISIDGEDVLAWNDVTRLVSAAIEAGRDRIKIRWMPFEALTEPMEARGGELVMQPIEEPDYGLTAQFKQRLEEYRTDGVVAALQAGFKSSVDNLRRLYMTLKRMIGGTVSATNLGGIITISVVSYDYASSGWERFLWFLAFLSLNLAFINVLPIPVLDGGHLLFLLIEKIKGSPVSVRVMTYAQVLGIVMVLGLLIFVTFNDIARLLQ